MKKVLAVFFIAFFVSVSGVFYSFVPDANAQACANPAAANELNCDPLSTQYNAACCYIYQSGRSNISDSRDIYDIFRAIGGFLWVASAVVAGIVIVISGIVWMSSGSNTARVGTAKAIFKNGIIGAVIIFAAGTIIQTIIALATDPLDFF